MTHKLFLVAALSTVAFAAPKSYNVAFTKAVQAGTIQLAPGNYKVVVDGSNAVFTDAKSKKAVTVPVRVESANRKYDSNTFDTVAQGGSLQLKAIELGGSKTKLEFGQ